MKEGGSNKEKGGRREVEGGSKGRGVRFIVGVSDNGLVSHIQCWCWTYWHLHLH